VTFLIHCVFFNDFFFRLKIVLQGHGTRVTAKSQQSGEKAFRCDYDGCGKLYTTAHHLKVKWGLLLCRQDFLFYGG